MEGRATELSRGSNKHAGLHMRSACLLLLALLAPRPASAQAVAGSAGTLSLTPPAGSEAPAPELGHRRTTAMLLALGGTFGGYAAVSLASTYQSRLGTATGPLAAVGAAGVFVGPSFGHAYAGEGGHVVGMTVLRAGGLFFGAMGYVLANWHTCTVSVSAAPGPGNDGCSSSPNAALGPPLLALGALAFVGGTFYDIVDAPRAVERGAKREWFTATPAVIRDPEGKGTPGVVVGARF